ncbi:hypothetical protein Tco_1495196, partial [Tanacetum coccineum]
YETFCLDIGENSSGRFASHSDHSLSNYEAFSFDVDHIKEKSSGSTTSHLEEFADELAHIISPPEYDRFYFDIEPDPRELTRRLEEIISEDSTKELTSPELNDLRLLLFDCDSIFLDRIF